MRWEVDLMDDAHVRLRSGKIGLVSVEASAPVSNGELHTTDVHTTFRLALALDQLKSPNFLMQRAARGIVTKHDSHDLTFDGKGPASDGPWVVNGLAAAGTIEVNLDVTLSPIERSDTVMRVELTGIAAFGEVSLPLPGLSNISDFNCDVDAVLKLHLRDRTS